MFFNVVLRLFSTFHYLTYAGGRRPNDRQIWYPNVSRFCFLRTRFTTGVMSCLIRRYG